MNTCSGRGEGLQKFDQSRHIRVLKLLGFEPQELKKSSIERQILIERKNLVNATKAARYFLGNYLERAVAREVVTICVWKSSSCREEGCESNMRG